MTAKAEAIMARMCRRRIPDGAKLDWTWQSTRDLRSRNIKTSDFVQSLLDQGHRVTAGYTTTQIRNFHDHWILWKP